MASTLPADIWLLICEVLGNQRDFGSLFNCALSGKHVAGPALMWIYRNHNLSPVTGAEFLDDTEIASPGIVKETRETLQQLSQRVESWSDMWRSIILSSVGQTLYPYCLYIRVLDLRNLKELFSESVFLDKASRLFFEGAVAKVLKLDSATAVNTRSRKRFDTVAMLAATGESITKYVSESAQQHHSTAALEELTGELTAEVLPVWTARLARLKTMTLWDGNVLGEDVAQGIRENCPHFKELSLFYCRGDEADHRLGNFISGLRPGSLETLEIINSNDVHAQTFLALNTHRQSLKELKLASLRASAMRSLSLLKGCTALQILNLQDSEGITLEATENDTFLEIIAWLKACTQLRDLTLQKFIDGPSIMTYVLVSNNIHLKSFDMSGYTLAGNSEFHQALAHQTDLESLDLRADAEEASRDDIEILINSISCLQNLRRLNLLDISDYFQTDNVKRLISALPKLADFRTGGYYITDDVFSPLSSLKNLRYVAFHAMTTFTPRAIMNYISSLSASNYGLLLQVLSQAMNADISLAEQRKIKEAIAAKVDGAFDFMLYREGDDEFDSDSD